MAHVTSEIPYAAKVDLDSPAAGQDCLHVSDINFNPKANKLIMNKESLASR
jgi:hypothetical protein